MSEKTKTFIMLMFVVLAIMLIFIQREKEAKEMKVANAVTQNKQFIKLPSPSKRGAMSLEEVISKRRSKRSYMDKSLSRQQISQVLWAGQGITDTKNKFRSAPSAGGLYPLEIYMVSKEALYHYLPDSHTLEKLSGEDLRNNLSEAAMGQSSIKEAPASIVITAVYERTTVKYQERGVMYVHIEAGHAAENIQLQAVALGLGSVPVGAFSEEQVSNVLSLPEGCKPLYIIPVGYAK